MFSSNDNCPTQIAAQFAGPHSLVGTVTCILAANKTLSFLVFLLERYMWNLHRIPDVLAQNGKEWGAVRQKFSHITELPLTEVWG